MNARAVGDASNAIIKAHMAFLDERDRVLAAVRRRLERRMAPFVPAGAGAARPPARAVSRPLATAPGGGPAWAPGRMGGRQAPPQPLA